MGKLGRSAIFDAGNVKPQDAWRRVTVPGSTETRIEKPPHGAHEKWVDDCGNVVFIKTVCGAAVREDDRYAARMRREQRAGGGIPYAKCVLRDEKSTLDETNFPPELGKPCKMKDERGAIYGYRKACPHVEHVIAQRTAKNAALCKKREDIGRRDEIRKEEELQLQREANEKMSSVLDHLVGSNTQGRNKK